MLYSNRGSCSQPIKEVSPLPDGVFPTPGPQFPNLLHSRLSSHARIVNYHYTYKQIIRNESSVITHLHFHFSIEEGASPFEVDLLALIKTQELLQKHKARKNPKNSIFEQRNCEPHSATICTPLNALHKGKRPRPTCPYDFPFMTPSGIQYS